MRQFVDSKGQLHTYNASMNTKVRTIRLQYDAKEIPQSPSDDTPPLRTLHKEFQDQVARALIAMEARPVWVRRALMNEIQSRDRWTDRHIYPYVGYSFISGPWKDTLIKYGVDPRIDPKFRIYQTVAFQIDESEGKWRVGTGPKQAVRGPRGGNRAYRKVNTKDNGLGFQSHIFNGRTVGLDGKTWQACDITDPLLQSILATTILPRTCDVSTGLF